ncbi:MAG: tetratricopeptide repeat protein [Kiloniellales bacterium]
MANESISIKIGRIALYSVVPLTWSHAVRETCDLAIAKLFESRIARDQILDTPSHKPDPYKDPPSHLLQEQYEIVPFAHREAEMAEFKDSAAKREPNVRVALLTGGPGRGKTRFARELCRQVMGFNDPWLAGFVSADGITDSNHFKPLMSWKGPLLLIVDYAERGERVAMTKALVHAAMDAQSERQHHQTRILLIARSDGDWWQSLDAAFDDVLDNPFDESRALRRSLEPLARPEGTGLQAEFNRAYTVFRELMKSTGGDVRDALTLSPTAAPAVAAWLPGRERAEALDLHMAALLAAFGDSPPAFLEGKPPEVAVIERLVNREQQKHWHPALDAADLAGAGLKGEPIAEVVAWASAVAPGSSREILESCLGHWPTLAGEALAGTRRSLAGALARLYPSTDGSFAGLAPDRLATFLTRRLSTTDLECAAAGLPQEALANLLRHLTWHVQRYSDAETERKIATTISSGDTEGLLAAFEIAAAQGDPIGQIASEALRNSGNELAAITIHNQMPSQTLNLRELAATATQILHDVAEEPELRALYANNLAIRLSDLGQREPALDGAQEAVDLYRDLADARPDAFRPDLAMSLNTLANRLSELGQHEPALNAAQEAVDIRRDLADARPDAFTADLARSLNNLANRLSNLGQREPALGAAQEAVNLYRDLADARPDAFRPDLAMSLNNLANCLSDLGQREPALDAAQEAVNLYRDLANARPDAFTADLARSLGTLGSVLQGLTQFSAANNAFKDGITTLRPYFFALPPAHTQPMAALRQAYVESCKQAGREPDEAFLAPIIEKLNEIESERESEA